MTTPTATTKTSTQCPVDYGNIYISAHLLYPYVAHRLWSFVEWKDSLPRMAANKHFIAMGYKLRANTSGALYLNLEFAIFFVFPASIAPRGAIARVILDEGWKAAQNGEWNHIDRALAQYRDIGNRLGLVQARALHLFLTPKLGFDDWFAQQKQEHRLVYGRNYARACVSVRATPRFHLRDTGKGELYLTEATAGQIIMGDPSPRGIQASEHLNDPMFRSHDDRLF